MRILPTVSVILLLTSAVVHGARIADEEQTSFDAGLDAVRRTMRARAWEEARGALLELLERHRGDDEVLTRRFEVEELLRQCAFRIAHPPPAPETLVSGELVERDPRTGLIELHYTPADLDDFEQTPALLGGGVVYIHPAVFDGAYSICVEGPSYPTAITPALLPTILADVDVAELYVVSFGQQSPADSILQLSSSAALIRRTAGEEESAKLTERKDPPTTSGEPFELEVRVNGRSIQASYNGRALLRGNRRDAGAGRIGFACSLTEFDKVVVRGKSNRSWLDGLAEAKIHEHHADFMASYDVNQDLPGWLRYPAPDPAASEEERNVEIELELTQEEARHVDTIVRLVTAGELGRALRHIQETPATEMSPFVKDVYRSLLLHAADELEDSLLCIERASEFRPDNTDVLRFKARLLAEVGRHGQAIDELDDLLHAAPDDAFLLHRKARSLYRLGRRAEAEQVIDAAIERSVRSPELDALKRLLHKSARGPDWNRPFRHQTKHFEVHSDISPKTCKEVGRRLERVYKTYQRHLHPADDSEGRRSSVYVFSTETGYLSHLRDIMEFEPRHTAGLYSHELKQLYLWQVPDHEMLRRTVAHEALHLYLDLISPDAPIWLHEGLAEYCEVAQFEFGDWTEGQIHETDGTVVRIARDELLPVAALLSLTREQFYRKALLHYAQSWAFVHFLRNAKSRSDFFDRWFAAVAAGQPADAAIREILGDLDLVQAEFDEYLDELLGA